MSAGDESDFHRHDHINYFVPKLGKDLLPSHSRGVVELMNGTHAGSSVNPKTPKSNIVAKVVCTKKGLPILESPCSNPMAWRIECISTNALDLYRDHTTNGSKCNAKIARYQRTVAPPTFTGIQIMSKSKNTEQMQFWFCPQKLQTCVMGLRSRSIVHYPTLPLVWLVKSQTNLTKEEVEGFEASGFGLEDGVSGVAHV